MINNKHEFNSEKIPTFKELNKFFDKINDNYKRSQLEMPASILLTLLVNSKTKDDVKAIERIYKHITFLGGEDIVNKINEEYKRLELLP